MRSKLCRLAKSFHYALQGLWYCVRRERNFRIHLTAACYALLLAGWLELEAREWGLLLLTVALVLAMELVNTAIEAVVDRLSPQRTEGGRIAKDAAAAAVLCCAAASVGVGIALFWRPAQLRALWSFFTGNQPALLALAGSAVLAALFIFGPEKEKERK